MIHIMFTGLANLNYLSFLFSCVGVQEYQATDIEIYHCPNCQLAHGPLVCKFYVIAWHCNGIDVLRNCYLEGKANKHRHIFNVFL